MADVNAAIGRALKRWFTEFKANCDRAVTAGGHQLHGGKRFQPLKPETVQSTGRVHPLTRSIARKNRLKVETLTGSLSNNHEAAIFHQTGTRHMPARPILEYTTQDEKKLLEYIREEVAREYGML
jgi:hypothetical protein